LETPSPGHWRIHRLQSELETAIGMRAAEEETT
jgi:hypothetical protein